MPLKGLAKVHEALLPQGSQARQRVAEAKTQRKESIPPVLLLEEKKRLATGFHEQQGVP
jgi:hypothetical protein